MATIYLSSTYEDLKDYRRVVFEALRKSGHDVIAMEDYVATDQRPVDQCLKDVAKADLYVGLFAFRYGYIPPVHHGNPESMSISELEFRQAEHLKKPSLTFIAKEDSGIPLKLVDAYSGDADKGERINSLRRYLLTEKLASSFSSPHELSTLVLAAVTRHLDNTRQPDTSIVQDPDSPTTVTWNIEKDGSPYPGLMHFTRKYAPVFFGRDAEVREILDRMREPEGRFIIVSGDSGVGKSSVVDAGVLRKLEESGLPGNEICESVRMLPSQSQRPFGSLMAALSSLTTLVGLRPDAILDELERTPDALPGHFKTITKGASDRKSLLIFIDQMEELFTTQDLDQANTFLTALYHAAQEKAVWVIATIRSDHLHYCYRHPKMVKVLNSKGHYALGRVEPFMMQDMIVKPAQCAGLSISDTFARRLVHDSGADSTNLPLLAFVLNQLFEKRADHDLSETVYNNLGGVLGAIGAYVKSVEERIRRELGSKSDEVLPKVFRTLARVQKEEGVPTRNRPLLSGFGSNLRQVVNLLVRERLLVTEGEGETATVSLCHERLFEGWPALQAYVAANKKQLVDQMLLENRARKWAEMGRPWFSGLVSGRERKDFRNSGVPTAIAKEYLNASLRGQWIRGVGIVLPIVLLVGLGAWVIKTDIITKHDVIRVQSMFMSIHVVPEMLPVDAGLFWQGNNYIGDPTLSTVGPVREVKMNRFLIGKTEVTFEEYDRFAIATGRELPNDQGWGRASRPVINVSWEEARAYAEWLSHETGQRYRLPTESEWEYAARSGAKDRVWAGTSDAGLLADYAVYQSIRTVPVGEKKPNELGLHDMSGNVWEWVQDCWHNNYRGAPMDGNAWLEDGLGNCDRRVLRGGSWFNVSGRMRVWDRDMGLVDGRYSTIGFRLAQDIE